METPDHIEFDVRPVDFGVVKDVVLGGLHQVAQAVRFAVSLPKEFAPHGNHTFDKHPLDTPVTQPAREWTTTPVPDVAGRDLLPNIQLGEE